MKIYDRYDPIAIVNKHELGPVFSSRAAGIPLVWVLPFAWTRPCYESGLLGDNPLTVASHFYPGQPLPAEAAYLKPYQQSARELGLPEPAHFHDLYSGDLTVITDLPEFTGVHSLPQSFSYSGPIFAKLNGEVPESLRDLDPDRPVIYFAMGSSGDPALLAAMLPYFATRPDWQVIAPIASRLEADDSAIPENVILSDWLPAHLVNPLADVALTHGGLGTLYTAVSSGTPIVGVAMSAEQSLNLRQLAATGTVEQIEPEVAAAGGFIQRLDAVLADQNKRQKAIALQARLARVDGPKVAAAAIRHLLQQREVAVA